MEPAPVRVEYDRTLEGLAAAPGRALGNAELRVRLGGEGTDLLTVSDRKKREREESSGGEHVGRLTAELVVDRATAESMRSVVLVALLLYLS